MYDGYMSYDVFFVQILFEVLAFCESFRSVSWSYIFIALEEGRLLTLSGKVSNLPTLLEEYLQSDQPIKLKDIFKRISSLLKHKGSESRVLRDSASRGRGEFQGRMAAWPAGEKRTPEEPLRRESPA